MPGVADQVAALGPNVRTALISPNADAQRLMGSNARNILDPARRPAVARAGRTQAAEVAKLAADVWHG